MWPFTNGLVNIFGIWTNTIYSAFLLRLLVLTNRKPMKYANESPLHVLAAHIKIYSWKIRSKEKYHFILLFKWSDIISTRATKILFTDLLCGFIASYLKSSRISISNLKWKGSLSYDTQKVASWIKLEFITLKS